MASSFPSKWGRLGKGDDIIAYSPLATADSLVLQIARNMV
jgi:hypothetical protein